MKISKLWIIIGVAILVLACVLEWHSCNKADDSPPTTAEKAFQKASAQNFAVLPDVKGVDHTGIPFNTYKNGQNTFSATTVAKDANTSLGGADTAAAARDYQRSQIEYWQSVALSSQDENMKLHAENDGLKRKALVYENAHIKFTYYPDDSTAKYQGHLKVNLLQHWKPKWSALPNFINKYGPKTSFVDLSTDDPNTIVSGFETFTIKTDPTAFALKGQVKTDYFLTSGRIVPSAGLVLNIGKFELGGRYYYSDRYQKFLPIVSAAFNVGIFK